MISKTLKRGSGKERLALSIATSEMSVAVTLPLFLLYNSLDSDPKPQPISRIFLYFLFLKKIVSKNKWLFNSSLWVGFSHCQGFSKSLYN